MEKYNYLAVRALAEDEIYNIGDTLRESYDWDYENDTTTFGYDNIKLSGTCGVKVDTTFEEDVEENILLALDFVKKVYPFETYVLIGGDLMECGSDENEIIIESAKVIKFL